MYRRERELTGGINQRMPAARTMLNSGSVFPEGGGGGEGKEYQTSRRWRRDGKRSL